jgi:hypothetical protein
MPASARPRACPPPHVRRFDREARLFRMFGSNSYRAKLSGGSFVSLPCSPARVVAAKGSVAPRRSCCSPCLIPTPVPSEDHRYRYKLASDNFAGNRRCQIKSATNRATGRRTQRSPSRIRRSRPRFIFFLSEPETGDRLCSDTVSPRA